MKVEIIPCLQDNYSYLIIDESNNNACVVDPSEAKPIIDYINHDKYPLLKTNRIIPVILDMKRVFKKQFKEEDNELLDYISTIQPIMGESSIIKKKTFITKKLNK